MIDAIEIGYAIKDRRAKLGLTQAQLAEAAGVSKRCLWSLELGQNPGVQLDKLTAVLGALGLDLAISIVDVVEPIEPIIDTAGTVPPSAQSESRTVTNTAADTTASAVAGTMPNTSSSQHASCTAPSMSPGTAKATVSNTSDANASGSIDALSILTGGRQ